MASSLMKLMPLSDSSVISSPMTPYEIYLMEIRPVENRYYSLFL